MKFARSVGFLIGAFALVVSVATAQPSTAKTYAFVPHAAFFSLEAKLPNLLDPQAFVSDASSVAAIGPQKIAHVGGVRPAFGVDDPRTEIVNAHGQALHLSLAKWFGAYGAVTLTAGPATTEASFTFAGLVPGGHYSLFENHFSDAGVTFTPADGTGTANSFTASATGAAAVKLRVPGTVTHGEALLLVYHSDGFEHGMERGQIGVVAHHQLIMRVP